MTARLTAELVVDCGECRPARFPLFLAWAATRPPRRAILSTAALFGGVGCSLLHIRDADEAVFTYLFGYALAVLVMVPWFFAEYRINEGWRR